MTKQYQVGDSIFVGVKHEVYTFATDTWAVTDPDVGFPKITILNPSGVKKVDAVAMSKVATGKFTYQYELPSTDVVGNWRGWVDVENGSFPDREHFSFAVKE